MNHALTDPFILAQDYPEVLSGSLKSGIATCIRFNRRGDLLASGRSDGTIVIFDVETNGIARKLKGHTRQIQSLSWSRTGRYLLSSSQDWKSILWDLQDGSRCRTVKFDASVYISELHPYDHLLFVASLFEAPPQLVSMATDIPAKHQLPTIPLRPHVRSTEPDDRQASQDAKQATSVTIFTPDGRHIMTGTNKGWINIIGTDSRQVIYSTHLCSSIIILLRLTSDGSCMVSNSSDRIIRTIPLPDLSQTSPVAEHIELEVEHKFQDVVNRLAWNHVAFSSSGDYVTATTYENHDVYVWERSQGSLVKILEGPREELGVVEWHPHKPFVTACGLETGSIYLWSIVAGQRWSALAPDFAEVGENIEYVEREDEFDIHPIEEIHKRRLGLEDEDVDVLGMDIAKADHDDGAFLMPVLLDMDISDEEEDVVAIGPGTMRRRSPGVSRNRQDGAEMVESGDERHSTRHLHANGSSRVSSQHARRR